MKNLSATLITFLALGITHNASSMSTLATRCKLSASRAIIPRLKARALSTALVDDNKVKPRRISPKEVSDWVSHSQVLLYGIDSATLKSIKEIQTSLEKIRTGCYCGDDWQDTIKRQKTLKLVSNAIKNLANKTKAKNCNPKSEIYTDKNPKA